MVAIVVVVVVVVVVAVVGVVVFAVVNVVVVVVVVAVAVAVVVVVVVAVVVVWSLSLLKHILVSSRAYPNNRFSVQLDGVSTYFPRAYPSSYLCCSPWRSIKCIDVKKKEDID